jgi:tetratricopeptide (TPR) repeat protein
MIGLLIAIPLLVVAQNDSATLRVDPRFEPTEGNQAMILRDNTPTSPTRAGLKLFAKHFRANDRVGAQELIDRKEVIMLPKSTLLLVIKINRPASSRPPGSSVSFRDLGRVIQQDALDAAQRDPADFPVEARIVGGPMANKLIYVLPDDIGRLVQVRESAGKAKAKMQAKAKETATKGKTADPNTRADDLFRLGENLMNSGNRAGAIEYYRKAVEVATDSPAAMKAKARLATLGVK